MNRILKNEKGVSYVELLISMVLLVVVVLAALTYSSFGLGGVGKEGNRRAALELARAQLEQLMATNITAVRPPDLDLRWLTCAGAPCVWTLSDTATSQLVTVGTLANMPMVTTSQFINDPTTSTADPETVEFTVKVWFTLRTTVDDDFNRVYLRTLRT